MENLRRDYERLTQELNAELDLVLLGPVLELLQSHATQQNAAPEENT